jgi:hypothetical protein
MTGSRGWDVNLINHLFHPHDADEILKGLIQSLGEGDFIAWHYGKSGVFYIKSVYNLALIHMERKEECGQSSGGVYEKRNLWNAISMAIIVPQKIRIFVWSAVSNSLAVQLNRVKHH